MTNLTQDPPVTNPEPVEQPSEQPSEQPTEAPTEAPAEEPAEAPTEEPGETPAEPEVGENQARAEGCFKVIEKILEEHNCVVQPYLTNPEWVGEWGDKLMMACTYGVRALPHDTPDE